MHERIGVEKLHLTELHHTFSPVSLVTYFFLNSVEGQNLPVPVVLTFIQSPVNTKTSWFLLSSSSLLINILIMSDFDDIPDLVPAT